jgi:hypothetical protein
LPEILTDAPFRIEPSMPLPLVCFVKFRNEDPITLESIAVKISQNNKTVLSTIPLQQPVVIEKQLWQKALTISLPENISGKLIVEVFIRYIMNGKIKKVKNGSFSGLKSAPIEVYRAKEPLPRLEGFHFGDIHFHSYREVENINFTAPLPASPSVARSMGLNFYAVSLHSYNQINSSYSGQLSGWDEFKNEVEESNNSDGAVIIPGEEISCRNSKGRNVRMLTLNIDKFVKGTGNSPKKWLPSGSEFTVKEALAQSGSKAVAFAVHPDVERSFFSKVILRKGQWKIKDFENPGLNGLQVYRTMITEPGRLSIDAWISMLLADKKLYLAAGSHADGNLNVRLRKRFPFSPVTKDSKHIFGLIRTGIVCRKPLTRSKVVSCLSRGASVVTNGPLLKFSIQNEKGEISSIGEEISGKIFDIDFNAISTGEFGRLNKLCLYAGAIGSKKEDLIYTYVFKNKNYTMNGKISFEPRGARGYIRGELWSGVDDDIHFCYTNPVWLLEDNS